MIVAPFIITIDTDSISRAAALLRAGKLVAFPTETVYGLGADATNDRAVAAIYAAKGRPSFNPLIIHVAETAALDSLIIWNDMARRLAAAFWPGPLTLVLPRQAACGVSLLASAGLETLAVRVPSHPVARDLLAAVRLPIAAPSANASGKLSPTTALHVAESLGNKVDLILAGGKSRIGLESTVVDVTGPAPVILRHGGIAAEQLATIIGAPVAVLAAAFSDHDTGATPAAPGMLASHYAPNARLRLNAVSVAADEALLAFGPDMHIRGGAMRLNLSASGDVDEAAANLFSMLRELDRSGSASIAAMPVPMRGLGAAINDRLQRAAAPREGLGVRG